MATEKKKRNIWVFVLPLLLLVAVMVMLSSFFGPTKIDTSEGLALLKDNGKNVERVVVNDGTQQVNLKLTQEYTPKVNGQPSIFGVSPAKDLVFSYSRAQAEQVRDAVERAEPKHGYDSLYPVPTWWESILQTLLMVLIFVGVFWFFMSRMQGAGGIMNFGKNRKDAIRKDMSKVRFSDVAGEDEAVEELDEIREFLSSPQKFHRLGAKIPKGVLLYGPPGTGKTLLAKAVAGEAGVPFFSTSGSEFVEMFVGVGASRVRDLFEQAKAAAPAIIFVDEIDAVGRHRGTGMGGGNDEREQTLNQLLVEMDGFDETTNVILIAATNRADVLDPALLRPGRFDRQVAVDAPDLKGREQILRVHAKDKPMTADINLHQIAKRTPGFTGADLANVLNEAALLTARSNADLIDIRALDEAIDRVIAGPQRRTRVMNDHDKLVTAYHEGGHALCAAALHYTDPVTKVTILPRGRALGYTAVMPAEDRFSKTRNQLLDELVYSMGGRVAEELVFRDPSTGAANDIEKATATARAMVTDYGLSAAVGAVKYGKADTQPFLGRDMTESRGFSEATAAEIDAEVRAILDAANREAWQVLSQNRPILDRIAELLLEKETILEDELKEIFRDVIKQPQRPVWNYGAEAAVNEAAFGNPIGPSEAEETPSQSLPPQL